jgi:hypothetical protein
MTLTKGPVQVTCSIGFCHSQQLPCPTGRALLDAAQVAGDEAARYRPGAIRGYSADLARARADRDALRAGFADAIDRGEIRAWFQPQLSTDSGAVTGIEALARWHHPDRGVLAPAAFLPAIEGSELMELLGQSMLTQSLAALAEFDRKGLRVPTVAVNFSAQELQDPQLPERLRWTLDRFQLAPARLTVEVLESVVAGEGDELIASNIGRIAAMGCGVDLDDFGTGQRLDHRDPALCPEPAEDRPQLHPRGRPEPRPAEAGDGDPVAGRTAGAGDLGRGGRNPGRARPAGTAWLRSRPGLCHCQTDAGGRPVRLVGQPSRQLCPGPEDRGEDQVIGGRFRPAIRVEAQGPARRNRQPALCAN